MPRHMCEEDEYAAIRRVCQFAENQFVLSIYGLDIPLCVATPNPHFILRVAYDKQLSHCENAINWLRFYQSYEPPSFSAYPLIGAKVRTTKRIWDDRFISVFVNANAKLIPDERLNNINQFELLGHDLAGEIDELPRIVKIRLVQSYLRAVITKVYEGYKKDSNLSYAVDSRIFVVSHEDEICINVGEDGGPCLFKLDSALKDRCFGGEGAKEVIECLDKHVMEERARQSAFINELIGGKNNNVIHVDRGANKLKYMLGDVHQAQQRLRRAGQPSMRIAQNTVIQGR